MGHLGQHPWGAAMDGKLHAVLFLCRHIRQLQQDIRLAWSWSRLHGLVVDLSSDRPARRRAQRGDGAPDCSRYDGRRLEASWLTRCDDGRSCRRGTSLDPSWIPCAWPHDGLQHDKGSGDELAALYRAQDLKILPERATFEDGGSADPDVSDGWLHGASRI